MDFAQILLVIDKMFVTMFAITGALLTGRRVLPLEIRAATSVQKRTTRFFQKECLQYRPVPFLYDVLHHSMETKLPISPPRIIRKATKNII